MNKLETAQDRAMELIGQKDHDQIRLLDRLSHGQGRKAVFSGQIIIGTAGTLSHHHFNPRIAQILGMGVPLAAVTDNGHSLVFQ